MICSLLKTVLDVADYLPPELILPQARNTLKTWLMCFPDALSHRFGFECRLGPDMSPVDFALLVTSADAGREILSGLHSTLLLPEQLFRRPGWARIRDFCVQWVTPSSALYRHVQGIWLEFDGESQCAETPPPGFFFHIGAQSTEEEAELVDHTWISDSALPLLCGSPTSQTLRHILATLSDHSSVGGELYQVGVFPSRKLEAVRLVLCPPSQERLLAFLSNVGWSGPLNEVASLTAPLYEIVDDLYLNVDVGENVFPHIGIECHFKDHKQPAHDARWAVLLAHLVESGLCTPEKQAALLNFPGYSLEDALYTRIFVRGLHHLKVVYRPDCALEAKAYIGFSHRPMNWINDPRQRNAAADPSKRSDRECVAIGKHEEREERHGLFTC